MNATIQQLSKDKKNIQQETKDKKVIQKEIKNINDKILSEYIKQFPIDPIPEIATNLDMDYIKLEANKDIEPRAVFLGYFRYMSLTCQRKWCKVHRWFYNKKAPMVATEKKAMSNVIDSWRNIGDKTKLIVIGDAYEFNDIKDYLYKNSIKRIETSQDMEWMSGKIPVVMESELHKQHPDYPNIDNNTDWSKTT